MIREGDGDPRHGTMSGYNRHLCRCDPCRRAWADYLREYRHRTGRARPRAEWLAEVKGKTSSEHGTERRYATGCRCDVCRSGVAAARRRRRRRYRTTA